MRFLGHRAGISVRCEMHLKNRMLPARHSRASGDRPDCGDAPLPSGVGSVMEIVIAVPFMCAGLFVLLRACAVIIVANSVDKIKNLDRIEIRLTEIIIVFASDKTTNHRLGLDPK